MGRHAQPPDHPTHQPGLAGHRAVGAAGAAPQPDSTALAARRPDGARRRSAGATRCALSVEQPPVVRAAVGVAGPVVHPGRAVDAPVALASLPPVPTTGARPAIEAPPERPAGRRADRAAPRRVQPVAERRRGGHLHGVLVYVTGLLMVLSSVYGVAYSVGDGDNVVTDTATSFRSWFGDSHGRAHGHRDKAGDKRPNAAAPTAADAAPSSEAPAAASTESAPVGDGREPEAGNSASPQSGTVQSGSVQSGSVQSGSVQSGSVQSGSAKPGTGTSTVQSATAPAPVGRVTAPSVPAGTWLSGAAGDGVADGSFAAWRGTPVTIGGTWADNNEAMTELWQLDPGGEFGSWDKALDIAIGAISDDESWQQAATGAYDERWRESLTNLKAKWGNRTAPLFIRFAHEMNGNWYPWSVNAGNKDAFVASWMHFRALQQEIFPAAKLVFSLNRESVGSGVDWRQSFPGAQYVDVIGVDYYNQYPYVASGSDWAASLDDVDKYGAPKGLQQHLDFARSVGLPLSIPEWSGHAGNGDSPAFIQGMHDFFAQHAGGGAGQVLYDVQFNIDMHDDDYRLFPSTRMSQSAEMYRQVF